MRKCARIKKSMRLVGIEACDLPTYEVFPSLEYFLTEFEEKLTET